MTPENAVRLISEQNADMMQYCPEHVVAAIQRQQRPSGRLHAGVSAFTSFFKGAKRNDLAKRLADSSGTQYVLVLDFIDRVTEIPIGQSKAIDRTKLLMGLILGLERQQY